MSSFLLCLYVNLKSVDQWPVIARTVCRHHYGGSDTEIITPGFRSRENFDDVRWHN